MQTKHIINRLFDRQPLTRAESAVLFGDIIQENYPTSNCPAY